MAGSQPRGLRMRVAFVAMTVALVGAAGIQLNTSSAPCLGVLV
jgi:hypothetical protein